MAHLFRTVVRRELAARGQLDCLGGAEFWLQIYKGGRGLGFHFDKVCANGFPIPWACGPCCLRLCIYPLPRGMHMWHMHAG